MKTFIILASVFICWAILAQGCMQFRISDKDAVAHFKTLDVDLQTATVEVDHFPIHYVKTGSDTLPTLFFVHGSPGSWNAFERYLSDKDLLSKYRMISIDRPGFGYSDFGEAKDLQTQSELMSPVIHLLTNQKPMYIIGHSLGGPMAVKLDADNPGVFSGMILLAGSVDPAEEKPEKWRPWLIKTPLELLVPGAMAPSNRELWYLKKDLVALKDDFGKVTSPVWIIHGDKDTFVPVGNADYAKKMLVNARSVETIILPGASHFIPWSRYEDIKKVLLSLHP